VCLPQSEPDENDPAGGDWNTGDKHHHLLETEEQEQELFDAHGQCFSKVISIVTLC
jgi:hypothetical protein